jgi:hypothetical protein
MNEPFTGSKERQSTVGTEKTVLKVQQTKTSMLDFERTESLSLMERAVRRADGREEAMDYQQSIFEVARSDMIGQAQVTFFSRYTVPLLSPFYPGRAAGGAFT